MKIYNYDNLGVYIGFSEARPDPLESGKWLIPRNAATIEPPVTVVNESAVFSEGAWSKVADFRGHPVWLKTTAEESVTDSLGEIPAEYTLLDPDGVEFPVWATDEWIVDTVARDAFIAAELRRSQIADAKADSGLADITVAEAQAYINEKLDTTDLDATGAAVNAATTVPALKSATLASLVEMRNIIIKEREVLLKMVPYLLN